MLESQGCGGQDSMRLCRERWIALTGVVCACCKPLVHKLFFRSATTVSRLELGPYEDCRVLSPEIVMRHEGHLPRISYFF